MIINVNTENIITMDLRIGILECDHVDPDLRDTYGDYDEMIANLVHTQDNSIEFSVYDLIAEQFPVDLNACDAYIITGSRFGVYEDLPWINKAKDLVKKLHKDNIPTVGICFGHQLIAESLGGKVVKAEDKGRGLGVQTWYINSQAQWMSDSSIDPLSLNACHQDQVIQLPADSELLLSSNFCPIAGFQKDNMLGIQGHPEFDTEYTDYLFNKHKGTLNKEAAKKSKDSFKIPADSNVVGAWMVNFIKSALKTH